MREAKHTSLLGDQEAYLEHVGSFISQSPTSFHAAHTAGEWLRARGFVELDESTAWGTRALSEPAFVIRDGAIVAWRAAAPTSGAVDLPAYAPLRVFGAHTDSPGFQLKPQPGFHAHGWAQVGVEVYGGPILASWFDRDLAIAGRLVRRDGNSTLVSTGPVARIPHLAIHLDRSVNDSFAPDKQRHLQPIFGVGGEGAEAQLLAVLARAAGISPEEIVGAELRLIDSQQPARLGINREFFASRRLDNLSSVVAGMTALAETEPAEGSVAMFAAFDHEELGSQSRSGASGPLLSDLIARLRESLGASVEDAARGMATSWCLSADAGHSVHPNYPEKHDPNVRPIAGGGPMLKVNANQRYASDGIGSAAWKSWCNDAGIVAQASVSHNEVPCGSTIGPLMATRLGIRTVDVGVPLLSMHSARELAHCDDLFGLARVAKSFFQDSSS